MELIFHIRFPQMLIQNLNHPKRVQKIQINFNKSLRTYTFQRQDIFGNHCHFGVSSKAVSNQVLKISETAYADQLNRAGEHSGAHVHSLPISKAPVLLDYFGVPHHVHVVLKHYFIYFFSLEDLWRLYCRPVECCSDVAKTWVRAAGVQGCFKVPSAPG